MKYSKLNNYERLTGWCLITASAVGNVTLGFILGGTSGAILGAAIGTFFITRALLEA